MSRARVTIAGMMAAVGFAAIDSFLIKGSEYFAGIFLNTFAMQAGIFFWLRSSGRRRRFWAGFIAAGLVEVIAYIPCLNSSSNMFVRWPFFLFDLINHSLAFLPSEAYLWSLRHVAIDLDRPLRVIDIIVVLEVSFGLPMVLLAAAMGLMSAFVALLRAPSPDAGGASGSTVGLL